MKKAIGLLLAGMMLFAAACTEGTKSTMKGNWEERQNYVSSETVELDKETVRDKLLGMWTGSAIGLGSGYEYCRTTNNAKPLDAVVVPGTIAYIAMDDKYWEPNGAIASGSIGVNALRTGPICDPRVTYNTVYSDDDMHVDVLNQFIFRDYGPDLGAQDIAAAWDHYSVADVGGGETVLSTIRNNGYMAPYTGQRMYGNRGYWVTESWIENETLGSIFPYMPLAAEAYAEIFTPVQGDALCLYLGKLCALMYSLAWQYDNPREVLEAAFDRMDKNNEIYEIYKYVVNCYEDGVDWRKACAGVVERLVFPKLVNQSDKAGFSINANAGMIFLGLIYGENDFEKSVKITSLAGLDGDCTACTVGGLIGLMHGFNNLPAKYKDYINGESKYHNYTNANSDELGVYWGAFAYCGKNFPNTLTFNEITDLTVKNLEAQIVARGGSIGQDKYTVAVQKAEEIPQVSLTNRSFERGDTLGWSFEGDEGTNFAATAAKAHLGEFGGMLETPSTEEKCKAYQKVSLIPGNRYRVTLWVLGGADREMRLFAGNKYRSYINPITAEVFVKLELYFTAEQANEMIGIEYMPGTDDSYSTSLFFDDFYVEDVTHLTDAYYQQYDVNDYYVSTDVTVNEKTVTLVCMGGLRFDFEGMAGYQTFKIYYKNPTATLAIAEMQIDGKDIGTIPLPAQGANADYNEGNCAIAYLYAGTGTHEFKLILNSFEDIEIERIEVYGGNSVFSK